MDQWTSTDTGKTMCMVLDLLEESTGSVSRQWRAKLNITYALYSRRVPTYSLYPEQNLKYSKLV